MVTLFIARVIPAAKHTDDTAIQRTRLETSSTVVGVNIHKKLGCRKEDVRCFVSVSS